MHSRANWWCLFTGGEKAEVELPESQAITAIYVTDSKNNITSNKPQYRGRRAVYSFSPELKRLSEG
jgi:hypothetical protein